MRKVYWFGFVVFFVVGLWRFFFGSIFEREELKVVRCDTVGMYMRDVRRGDIFMAAARWRLEQLHDDIISALDRPEKLIFYMSAVKNSIQAEARPNSNNLDHDILRNWENSDYCKNLVAGYVSQLVQVGDEKNTAPDNFSSTNAVPKVSGSSDVVSDPSNHGAIDDGRKLSDAAKKAVEEGFVEITDPKVQRCTDEKLNVIRKNIGEDGIINYEVYNEAAVACGFNI